MTTEITVTRLPRNEHAGDWHDAPLRYIVSGPGAEAQKFSTKREACNYAIDRCRSATQREAIERWMLRK